LISYSVKISYFAEKKKENPKVLISFQRITDDFFEKSSDKTSVIFSNKVLEICDIHSRPLGRHCSLV